MISLLLAKKLKEVGFEWTPALNDFFAVPDRGLDDTVFVISNMTVMVATIQGHLAMTFHGASEWALDHVFFTELVWLPRESQLREAVERRLISQPPPSVTLFCTTDGYRCEIQWKQARHQFEAFSAADAYGLALLHLLEN